MTESETETASSAKGIRRSARKKKRGGGIIILSDEEEEEMSAFTEDESYGKRKQEKRQKSERARWVKKTETRIGEWENLAKKILIENRRKILRRKEGT